MKKENDDNDLVYFKGGLITKLQFKRALVGIAFGLVGVACSLLINQGPSESNTITKIIVFIFTLVGYLVGVQIFPKKKN